LIDVLQELPDAQLFSVYGDKSGSYRHTSGFHLRKLYYCVHASSFCHFLCIRMVSNTKKAGAFTVLLTGLFVLFHWEEMQSAFISIVKSIAVSPLAIFGAVLGCTGVFGLLKGLYDEEQSEEYVHKRQYWNGIIAIMYLGIVLACHGSGG